MAVVPVADKLAIMMADIRFILLILSGSEFLNLDAKVSVCLEIPCR